VAAAKFKWSAPGRWSGLRLSPAAPPQRHSPDGTSWPWTSATISKNDLVPGGAEVAPLRRDVILKKPSLMYSQTKLPASVTSVMLAHGLRTLGPMETSTLCPRFGTEHRRFLRIMATYVLDSPSLQRHLRLARFCLGRSRPTRDPDASIDR